jgi:hypothetical protein
MTMILKISLNMEKAGKDICPLLYRMTKTSEVFPDGMACVRGD